MHSIRPRTHTKILRKTQCIKTPLLFDEELDVRGFSRGKLDAHCASLDARIGACPVGIGVWIEGAYFGDDSVSVSFDASCRSQNDLVWES